MTKNLLTTVILGLFFLNAPVVKAVTVAEFSGICDTAPGGCSEHPILLAYVGGALDLLATLDEETPYMDKLYCRKPGELFDVPAIISFMGSHSEGYETRNAMLLVIRYFEENGGCDAGE